MDKESVAGTFHYNMRIENIFENQEKNRICQIISSLLLSAFVSKIFLIFNFTTSIISINTDIKIEV